jgi:hypothetical protein
MGGSPKTEYKISWIKQRRYGKPERMCTIVPVHKMLSRSLVRSNLIANSLALIQVV